MASLSPVDYDPFAEAGLPPDVRVDRAFDALERPPLSLTPVDDDPFATEEPPRAGRQVAVDDDPFATAGEARAPDRDIPQINVPGASIARGFNRAQQAVDVLLLEAGLIDFDTFARNTAINEMDMARFPQEESTKRGLQEISEAEGFVDSAVAIARNPGAVLDVVGESLPLSGVPIVSSIVGGLAGAGTGAAVGSVAPGAGTAAGAVTGLAVGVPTGAAAGSFAIEYSVTIADVMREQGVDFTDPDAIVAGFKNPAIMGEARIRGIKRGIPIALLDAVSAGVAGKIAGPVRRTTARVAGPTASRATGEVAELGAQASLGSTGEAGAQIASEGEITSPGEVLLEGVAEIPTGVAEVAIGRARDRASRRATQPAVDDAIPEGAQPAETLIGEEVSLTPVDEDPFISEPAAETPQADADTVRTIGELPSNIADIIDAAAERYGQDAAVLRGIAFLESSGDPNAQNDVSSAGGLFQFIDDTADLYGLEDRFDPEQASDAAARLLRDNRATLVDALGREPTAGELYLAHQQGAQGAIDLLSNPNALAVDVVGVDEVRLNGGDANMTAGAFASLWTSRLDGGRVATGPARDFPRTVAFERDQAPVPGTTEAVSPEPDAAAAGPAIPEAVSTQETDPAAAQEAAQAAPTLSSPAEAPQPASRVLGRRRAARRRPLTAMEFLALEGGIRDQSGELAAMGLGRRFIPGIGPLARQNGRTLDQARALLEEAGYIPPSPPGAPPTSSIDDMLGVLEAEARGAPVFAQRDQTEIAELQAQARFVEGQEQAGRELDNYIAQENINLVEGEYEEALARVLGGQDVEDAVVEVLERSDLGAAQETEDFPNVEPVPFFTSAEDRLDQATSPGRGEGDRQGGSGGTDAPGGQPVSDQPGADQAQGARERPDQEVAARGDDPEASRAGGTRFALRRDQPRAAGVSGNAGKPVSSFRNTRPLTRHADFKDAKAGDRDAALRLVVDLVKPEKLAQAAEQFGADVTYVPVVSEEATGRNAIPRALATYYSVRAGGDVTSDIAQSNRAFHTGAGAMERLLSRPRFDGQVTPGIRYVIVDDVATMGSTVAELASHINQGGGEVAGIVLLVDSSRTSIFTPNSRVLGSLQEKLGNAITDLLNIAPEALTAAEAAYLDRFRDVDSFRAKVAEATSARRRRLHALGVVEEDIDPDTTRHRISDTQELEISRPDTARLGREYDQVEADLRQRLDKLGLKQVALRVVGSMRLIVEDRATPADGRYTKNLIEIALDAPDRARTLDHEAIHALVSAGLFRKQEMAILRSRAEKQWIRQHKIPERYADLPKHLWIEEAIAHAFEDWRAGRGAGKGAPVGIFRKMQRLLEALGNALKGRGFRTVEDVFGDVASGEIGSRPSRGASDQQAFQIRSRDGDLFESEIVETPDGPREQFVVPGAKQVTEKQRLERRANARKASGKAQRDTSGLPLFGDEQDQGSLFSLRREPQTAEDGQRAAQGWIARGQFLDRAVRLPFDFLGGVDGEGRWKPGIKIAEKSAEVITNAEFADDGVFAPLNGILRTARSGLIDRYGLDPEFVARERKRALDERAILSQGQEFLETITSRISSADEAAVMQAILTGEKVDDAAMQRLAEPIRNAIDELGQEGVALGLISAESYERNRGSYLHRVYLKNETDQNSLARFAERIFSQHRKRIVGSQLKGRGIFLDVPLGRLMRDNPEFREGRTGRPAIGDKFRVLDDIGQQTDALDEPANKVLRRVYWPADKAVPDRYAGFRDNGVWEIRADSGGNLTIWRDYTKDERTRMGEILDARYTIAKTYMLMANDLATGRFFKDISENENWSMSAEPPARWVNASEANRFAPDSEVQWIKVPDATIPNTGGKKRWGALAGRYVRAEIWRDLNELDIMNRPGIWRKLLTQWKLNKTARSPVVHMNNVMSNLIFMDLADVRMQDLARGIRAYATENKDFQEAVEHGAFGADMMAQEIRQNVLQPILEDLQRDMQGGAANSFFARAAVLGRMADRLWSGVKKADRFMVSMYQAEDEIFRMATYMRRRQFGDTPQQAADFARQQFLDYDIRAPWVNAARNSVLPFISYTYRAAPLIAKAIAHRPWKLAKYFTVAYALNALAYGWDDEGDETRERASLRKQEQGYTWVGVPRLIRMPYRDQNGLPVFLDVRRWIPAGDIFDLGQGQSALPVPAPLQFGGPLMLGAEFFLNRSAFTGDDIRNKKIDTLWESTLKTGDWAWKSWMPSAAWVPGSWYWEKLEITKRLRAAVTDEEFEPATDAKGRPRNPPLDLASSFGVKLRAQDVEQGLHWRFFELRQVERELKKQALALGRQRERGRISERAFNQGMHSIMEKMGRVGEQAQDLQRRATPTETRRQPALQ